MEAGEHSIPVLYAFLFLLLFCNYLWALCLLNAWPVSTIAITVPFCPGIDEGSGGIVGGGVNIVVLIMQAICRCCSHACLMGDG